MLSLSEFVKSVYGDKKLSHNSLGDYAKYCRMMNEPFFVTDEELVAIVVNHYASMIVKEG